jgi:hypothetical protein
MRIFPYHRVVVSETVSNLVSRFSSTETRGESLRMMKISQWFKFEPYRIFENDFRWVVFFNCACFENPAVPSLFLVPIVQLTCSHNLQIGNLVEIIGNEHSSCCSLQMYILTSEDARRPWYVQATNRTSYRAHAVPNHFAFAEIRMNIISVQPAFGHFHIQQNSFVCSWLTLGLS